MQLRHISRCFGVCLCYIIFFDLDTASSEEKPIMIPKDYVFLELYIFSY